MFTQSDTEIILAAKKKLKDTLLAKGGDFNFDFASTKYLYVTGGAIASYLQGVVPNDIDVYCRDTESAKKIKKYFETTGNDFVAEINEKYREATDSGKLITENAITLKNNLQFIVGHTGEPHVLRKTFDFTHCLPYYNPIDDKLYISYSQYRACIDKKLVVNNPNFVTPKRKKKFLERGYTIGD